jgi:tRNA A37 threonylcarbamoyladenosine dehydratase
MKEIFSRNTLYWGDETQKLLESKHVAVFGLGGVGGFCAEMLARSGVGTLTIVDFDKVAPSNINRQLIALNSTIGMDKSALFETRLKDINPDIKINVINDFYTPTLDELLLNSKFDFIADAIDTMRSKISLLEWAHKNKIPVISSFGAGNRIDPTNLYICDISQIKERNTPFTSNVLYRLRQKGIVEGITVVTSSEKPFSQEKNTLKESVKTKDGDKIEYAKIIPASTPFVASTSGIYMASHIVQTMIV